MTTYTLKRYEEEELYHECTLPTLEDALDLAKDWIATTPPAVVQRTATVTWGNRGQFELTFGDW